MSRIQLDVMLELLKLAPFGTVPGFNSKAVLIELPRSKLRDINLESIFSRDQNL